MIRGGGSESWVGVRERLKSKAFPVQSRGGSRGVPSALSPVPCLERALESESPDLERGPGTRRLPLVLFAVDLTMIWAHRVCISMVVSHGMRGPSQSIWRPGLLEVNVR